MRFSLRQGSREVLVFDRMRLVQFDTIEEAAEFLLEYARQPENMAALRQALSEEPQYSFAAQGDEAMVLVRAADLMVAGRLHIVDDPMGQNPWSWAFPPTPNMPLDYKAAEGEETEALAEEDETEENETEPEEVKPEPVIPPEYPALAKREGDALIDTTFNYNLQLDLLRFMGMGSIPESQIPKEVMASVASIGNHLIDESKGIGAQLLPLATEDGTLVPDSEVAIEVQNLGSQIELPLLMATASFGAELQTIAGQQDVSEQPSEVGKTVQVLGEGMRDPIMASALAVGAQLQALMGGDNAVSKVSEVGGEFQSMGAQQGFEFAKSSEKIGEALTSMVGAAEEPSAGTEEDKSFHFTFESASGLPMAGERYKVELANGLEQSGLLDETGSAVVKEPGDGPCKVSFPGVVKPWKLVGGEMPEMTVYTVVRGDTLGGIAKKFKMNWVELYEHEANAEFRALRKNPNIIYPGDQIYIPNQAMQPVEVQIDKPAVFRVVDPFNEPEVLDDGRIWVKYFWQKGQDPKVVFEAHEDLDNWEIDVWHHSKNAKLFKSYKHMSDLPTGTEVWIPVPNKPEIEYKIQSGDTPESIAKSHGVNWVSDIFTYKKNADFLKKHPAAGTDLNNHEGSLDGAWKDHETIYIPRERQPEVKFLEYTCKPCDYPERIADAFQVDWNQDILNHWRNFKFKEKRGESGLIYPDEKIYILESSIPDSAKRTSVEEQYRNYKIEQGDTLASIAERRKQDWKKDIFDNPANALYRSEHPNENTLSYGSEICLPRLENEVDDIPQELELDWDDWEIVHVISEDKTYMVHPVALTWLENKAKELAKKYKVTKSDELTKLGTLKAKDCYRFTGKAKNVGKLYQVTDDSLKSLIKGSISDLKGVAGYDACMAKHQKDCKKAKIDGVAGAMAIAMSMPKATDLQLSVAQKAITKASLAAARAKAIAKMAANVSKALASKCKDTIRDQTKFKIASVAGEWSTTFTDKIGGSFSAFHDSNYFDASGEATALRLYAGGQAEIAFSKETGLSASASGQAGFDLLRGSVQNSIYLGGKDGIKLLNMIPFRCKLTGALGGYVGVSAQANLELKVASVSENPNGKKTGGRTPLSLSLQGEAFAGAEARLDVKVAAEWRASDSGDWATLAELAAFGSAQAGAGAAFDLTVAVKGGKLKFTARAGACLGFGLKGGFEASVDLQQGAQFILALLKQAKYAKLDFIDKNAFLLTVARSLPGIGSTISAADTIANITKKLNDHFNNQAKVDKLAKEIHTGTSKDARCVLGECPPELKGAAINTLCQASMFGNGACEEEEEAVLKILKSINSLKLTKAEKKKYLENTLKHVCDLGKSITAKEGVKKIDSLVDWNEQTAFDNFLKDYNLSHLH